MHEAITKAIAEVMAGVPKLAKGERNSHGNYNFASIDDFLEAVRPLMATAGLVIASDEAEFEVIGEGKEAWLKMVFAFTIHCSGQDAGPYNRTGMVRASMGSQAMGAAQSYAEKQFLRSLFKIATGEGAAIDADSHQQTNLPVQQGKKKAEPLTGPLKTRAEARVRYGEIVRELHACEDEDTLSAFLFSINLETDQFERELPLAWNGDGMELAGLAKEIADAKTRVMAEAA